MNKGKYNDRKRNGKGKIYLLLCICMAFLCACSTYTKQSYTFSIETGDKVEVELKTNEGYALFQEGGRFQIKENDIPMMEGMFVLNDLFAKEYDALLKEENTSILQEDVRDGNAYKLIERTLDSMTGYYYIVEMKDSNVSIILDTTADKKKAKEVFDRLTFTLE